ncbi:MAG: hypothetical protein EXX96DRAFT_605062 [Benjaminiella poitrasii]|nr:MAG: hypothetical protein EXX96DRAFT_605062 [Benjaminiella poitrasii]
MYVVSFFLLIKYTNYVNDLFYHNFTTSDRHTISGPLVVGSAVTDDCSTSLDNDLECSLKKTYSSAQFEDYWSEASNVSRFLEEQRPTHRLTPEGTVEKIHDSDDDRFWLFNFGPCSSTDCHKAINVISDTSRIFFGHDNWNGPSNEYPSDRTVIFNIGVLSGSSMTVTTSTPSAGLSACRVVYNFYPVRNKSKRAGIAKISNTGEEITVYRATQGVWGGLVMNLHGPVYDGSEGNFAGQLVAQSYQWINASHAADILDYEAIDETCYGEQACQSTTPFLNNYFIEIQTVEYDVTETVHATFTEVVTDHTLATVTENAVSLEFDTVYELVSTVKVFVTTSETTDYVTVTAQETEVITLLETSTLEKAITEDMTTVILQTYTEAGSTEVTTTTTTTTDTTATFINDFFSTTITTTTPAYVVETIETTTTVTLTLLA